MDKFWRTFGASFLALVAWGLLVVLLASCAASRPYTPVISLPMDFTLGGVTTCDATGEPVIVMNAHHINNPHNRFTLAHEYVHAKQIREYPGGCVQFLARYRVDDQFRMEVEAEAICGEFYLAQSEGLDTSTLYQRILQHLVSSFPDLDVEKNIPCRGGGHGRPNGAGNMP